MNSDQLNNPLPCPVCQKLMVTRPLALGFYQECDTHGIWLLAAVLARIKSGRYILNELFKARKKPVKSNDDSLKCPRCRIQMLTTLYPQVPGLILDQCCRCNGIWFDVGELNRIKDKGDLENKFSSDVSVQSDLPEDLKNRKWRDSNEEVVAMADYHPLLFFGLPIEEEKNVVTKWPAMTVALVIIMFLFTARGLKSEDFMLRFLFVPTDPLRDFGVTLLTGAFLHGSWSHFFSNIYFFYLCSDNIEELEGSQFLLILFLSCVIGGHVAYMMGSGHLPTIGASGGVTGIMTYYVFNFPKNRFRVGFLSFFYGFKALSFSASMFFAAYLASQIIGFEISRIFGGTTNYLAHFGGFAVGLLFVFVANAGKVTHLR